MLGRRVRVLHLLRLALGGREDLAELARDVLRASALDARQAPHLHPREVAYARGIDARLLQQARGRRGLLGEERGQQVQRRDLGMARSAGCGLRCGKGFLGDGGEFVESHREPSWSARSERDVQANSGPASSGVTCDRACRIGVALSIRLPFGQRSRWMVGECAPIGLSGEALRCLPRGRCLRSGKQLPSPSEELVHALLAYRWRWKDPWSIHP